MNRWYLLIYTMFSFLLPSLDISSIFSSEQIEAIPVIHNLPSVNQLWQPHALEMKTQANFFTWQHFAATILLTGTGVMICRLMVQLISLYRITRNAQLLVPQIGDLYALTEPVMPFSFVNRIYITKNAYSDKELEEIIAHERTHIHQKHYLDTFFMQLVLMAQWFNPFAWLLHRAMRENLEFLADESVLCKGIEPTHYQYHLLKITSTNINNLSNQFSFSSLKTRIIMMNKKQTSKVQLMRLLILLPVTVTMLVAFRSTARPFLTNTHMNMSGTHTKFFDIREHQINEENSTAKKMHFDAISLDTTHPKKDSTISTSNSLPATQADDKGMIHAGTVYQWSVPKIEDDNVAIAPGTVYVWSAPITKQEPISEEYLVTPLTGSCAGVTRPFTVTVKKIESTKAIYKTQTAEYTVTPISGGSMKSFTVTVTIPPGK